MPGVDNVISYGTNLGFALDIERRSKVGVDTVLWVNKPGKHFGKYRVVAMPVPGELVLKKVTRIVRCRYKDLLDHALGG